MPSSVVARVFRGLQLRSVCESACQQLVTTGPGPAVEKTLLLADSLHWPRRGCSALHARTAPRYSRADRYRRSDENRRDNSDNTKSAHALISGNLEDFTLQIPSRGFPPPNSCTPTTRSLAGILPYPKRFDHPKCTSRGFHESIFSQSSDSESPRSSGRLIHGCSDRKRRARCCVPCETGPQQA